MSIVAPVHIKSLHLALAISLAMAWVVPSWAQDFSPTLGEAPSVSFSKPLSANYQASRVYNAANNGLSIDPSQREASRICFDTLYQGSEGIASGWTGNVAQGAAGATAQNFRNNIALRVNYFRAMAGVPAVIALADAYNAKDQQAALMMSANNQLSHYPALSWLNYTADGADAAHNSNIALGYSGPAAVTAYMQDDGSTNALIGHRRWLLYPQTTAMGTGDVDGANNADGSLAYFAANALWVIDGHYGTTRPATRDNFVAWPPPGYVPYQLVFNRWSFAYPDADFSQATVSMQRGGNAVPVRLETQASEYGENTLVWVPDNLDASGNGAAPTPPASDVTTAVTIRNVLVSGVPQTFSYNVTIFDPHTSGADTVLSAIGGPDALTASTAATYTFNAVPNATTYQWQAGAYSALSYSAGAESGPGDVTFFPAGANLVTTAYRANGIAAYQLTSQPATALKLNPIIVPSPMSALRFNSRFGYATAKETAKAQISADGGATWQDLYIRAGTGAGPDGGFAPITVPLGAYAGKLCQIRFSFANAGNYYLPSASVGWFLDDISVTDAGQFSPLSAPTTLPTGARSFTFAPPQSGAYALQVTPVFYNQYPDLNLAGPLKWITASANAAQQPTAPVFTNATATSAWLNAPFSYQIAATNNPTVYSAAMLPPGLSIDPATGQITGTPTMAGTYAVALSAANAAGSAAAMLALTVLSPPPVIADDPVIAGQVNAPFSYQISATAAPTSFAAAGLPSGLNVDNATGLISGVPMAEGEFPVTLSAANSSGAGTATVTLKISSSTMTTVMIAATSDTLRVGDGQVGEIMITRIGDDLSQDMIVNYAVAGGAVAGVDFQPLKGVKKIKAGRQSARVLVYPMGSAGNGDVKKLLKVSIQPSGNYMVGSTAEARLKMWW